MEKHGATVHYQWCTGSSSSKLKEPLVDFDDDDLEVADILLNLPSNFLNRIHLETNVPVNQAASELPQNFKNLISDMGGSRITLVIEKTLYHSDLNPQQNRLSIPSQKVKDRGFLLPTELEILEEKKGIKVKLIQPSLEITELTLVKWFMHKGKDSEKVSTSYILRSNWIKVAKANNLEKDDVVQVWSFRVEEKLCMAIVKL